MTPLVSDALVVRCELREVRWPLAATAGMPAIWSDAGVRAGTLVRISDEAGHVGIGEASPLPIGDGALAADTAALAAAELARFAAFVDASTPVPDEAFAFAATLASPAAQFAVETALYGQLAGQQGEPLSSILRAFPPLPERVPVNAVVTDVDSARAAQARGITTFKLKLGPDPEADLAALMAIREALGDAVVLRGDANQAWPSDVAEVARRLALLAPARLAYIEEPCRELSVSLAAAAAAGQPIALDESAFFLPLAELERTLLHPQVAALIVKPSRFGLFGCMTRAWVAKGRQKPIVVTHALEGPVATAACAELARALAAEQLDVAVGLDAHPGLPAWSVAPLQHARVDQRGELCAVAETGLGLEARWDELVPG